MIQIRLFVSIMAAILSLLALSHLSIAQDQPATATTDFDPENPAAPQPKALKQVKGIYPSEAKNKQISGIVVVEIVVDQAGKVTSPRAISGHPILRPAAVTAAHGWEFEIPMLNGKPTRLLGTITFCFLATKDNTKSRYTFSFEKCCPNRIRKPDDWCSPSEPQTAQETEEFIKRFTDERFRDISGGMMWTLIHDYKDQKHLEAVLNTWQRYMEALAKYKQGDGSSLDQLGGVKQLKDQLAIMLNDDEQAIRAFAATILGISGDQRYARQIAELLVRKEKNPDNHVYDRGRAALALGLLQAKEYGKDLVKMLASKNDYDRSGAVQGLGWMGDKVHAKAVAKLLNDKDQDIREATKQALEMMRATELSKEKK